LLASGFGFALRGGGDSVRVSLLAYSQYSMSFSILPPFLLIKNLFEFNLVVTVMNALHAESARRHPIWNRRLNIARYCIFSTSCYFNYSRRNKLLILHQIFARCSAGWWDCEKLKLHHKSFFAALFVGLRIRSWWHVSGPYGPFSTTRWAQPCVWIYCDQTVSLLAEMVRLIIRYFKAFYIFFYEIKE